MRFNEHSKLVGLHAFLSASKHHWVNYDDEKLIGTYLRSQEAARGTELHDLAARLIRMGIKLPKTRQTFNMYVNDAIGYRMTPEQVLVYSPICFGTVDAISFKPIDLGGLLRIHDLKNGVFPTHMRQLMIYAALFCLEYNYKPGLLDIILRIYKGDDIDEYEPTVEEIAHIMDRIVTFDDMIMRLKAEEM